MPGSSSVKFVFAIEKSASAATQNCPGQRRRRRLAQTTRPRFSLLFRNGDPGRIICGNRKRACLVNLQRPRRCENAFFQAVRACPKGTTELRATSHARTPYRTPVGLFGAQSLDAEAELTGDCDADADVLAREHMRRVVIGHALSGKYCIHPVGRRSPVAPRALQPLHDAPECNWPSGRFPREVRRHLRISRPRRVRRNLSSRFMRLNCLATCT